MSHNDRSSGLVGGPRPFARCRLNIVFQTDNSIVGGGVDTGQIRKDIEERFETESLDGSIEIRSGRAGAPSEIVVKTRDSIMFESDMEKFEGAVRRAVIDRVSFRDHYVSTF